MTKSEISSPLLQMDGIFKTFDSVAVLKDVQFTLHQGEIVGLLGENGAGKSTLMKILSGIYTADRGNLSLNGVEHRFQSVRDAMKLGIVLIHQELNLVDNLDVASNIFLGREPIKYAGLVDNNKLFSDASQLLQRLGLKISPGKLVGSLSIAEQQMIEIAKALSQNARILIMDEPTSSLSSTETKILFELIHDLKQRGVSIIYISHRLNEVYEIADRAVILKDGCNSGNLRKDEINHDNVVKFMVGRKIENTISRQSSQVTQFDFIASGIRTEKYPDKTLSFKIGRGEIVGLAGLVGAGRTELANTIFGITPLIDGEIILNGRNISVAKPSDAIGHGIFLVPEDRRRQGIITEMNVIDNITLTRLRDYSTWGYVRTDVTEEVTEAQSGKLNIKAASKEVLVKYLSGGNQQKIAIAKWLSIIPNLIIFDEPTRGVDIGAKSEIYKIMRQIADADAMVLVISSDMEEIVNISDRIIVMHEGEIIGEVSKSEFDQEKIVRLAVGP